MLKLAVTLKEAARIESVRRAEIDRSEAAQQQQQQQRGNASSGSSLPVPEDYQRKLEERKEKEQLQQLDELKLRERRAAALLVARSALDYVKKICGGTEDPERRTGNVKKKEICDAEDEIDKRLASIEVEVDDADDRARLLENKLGELTKGITSKKALLEKKGETSALERFMAEEVEPIEAQLDAVNKKQSDLNSVKGELNQRKKELLGELEQRIEKVRAATKDPTFLPDCFKDFDAAVRQHKCGNCADLASAALSYLLANHHSACRPFHYLTFSHKPDRTNSFDHVVLGIGGTRDRPLAYCDPWANVSCHGEDYNAEFREKMTEWQTVLGLKIRSPGGSADPRSFGSVVNHLDADNCYEY